MKLLLTGVAGRIAHRVVEPLLEAGHEVRAVDRNYRPGLPVRLEVENLLEPTRAYHLLEGAEVLIHFANHSNQNSADAHTVYNENVVMNWNLFEAARALGLRHIIFASSIQAMSGNRTVAEADEKPSALAYLPADGDLPAVPGNYYALSKQASEHQLAYLVREFNMNCTALRLPYIPTDLRRRNPFARHRQPADTLSPRATPDELFSFLPPMDVARLLVALLEHPQEGFRIYLPASEGNYLGWPSDEIVNRFHRDVPQHKPIGPDTPLIDNSRITADTGWKPTPIDQLDPATA